MLQGGWCPVQGNVQPGSWLELKETEFILAHRLCGARVPFYNVYQQPHESPNWSPEENVGLRRVCVHGWHFSLQFCKQWRQLILKCHIFQVFLQRLCSFNIQTQQTSGWQKTQPGEHSWARCRDKAFPTKETQHLRTLQTAFLRGLTPEPPPPFLTPFHCPGALWARKPQWCAGTALWLQSALSSLCFHLCWLRSWIAFCRINQSDVIGEANFLEMKIKISWGNLNGLQITEECCKHHITMYMGDSAVACLVDMLAPVPWCLKRMNN